MASIVFDFLARTVGLDKALKEENQKVGDFVKNVEKGTEKIDKSFDKMGKSAKDALKEQRQLIKEIEQDVKKLEKAVADATPGKGRKDMVNELRSAKKALAEEQGTLVGMQNQQIEANEKEVGSQGKLLSSLGKWAAGLFTAGVALKMFKGVMNSTESTQIKFEQLISGAKAGVQYFYRALASGDFKNFISGMGQAVKAAADFVEKMDEINNLRNEAAIKESEDELKVRELRENTYDKDSANNLERSRNLKEMIELERQIYDRRKVINQELLDATLERVSKQYGVSQTEIKYLLREYSSLEDVIKKGEEYNRLRSNIRAAQQSSMPFTGGASGAGQIAYYENQISLLGEGADKAGEYVKRIGKIGIETRNEITNAWTTLIRDEGEYYNKTRRYGTQLANVTKEMWDAYMKEIEDANTEADNNAKERAKTLKEAKNAIAILNADESKKELLQLEQKYKEDMELYKKDKELQVILTEKYELEKFEIEKKYLKKLVDEAMQAADKLAKIPGISPYSITQRYLSGLSSSGVTQTGALPSGLMPSHADTQTPQNIETELEKQIRLRQEILYLATSLTAQLAEQLGLEEDAIARLSELAGIIEGVASQNYAQAASSLVSFITENIKAYDTWEQVIDLEKLERLAELSEKAQEKGGAKDALQAEIDALNSAKKDAVWALEYAENKLQHANSINRQIREDNVAAAKETLKQIESQFEAAQKALDDVLTGGITRNTIADAVTDGFTEGGRAGIDNVADYMSNVLRDAASQIFKQSILDDPAMQQYIDATKKALSDGILSPQEKAQFDKMAKEMGEKWGPAWESLMGSFDTMGQAGGLTGAIKGVTEDTASELAGILRGVRDDVRASRAVDRAGLMHLAMIEANTKATADNTSETNKKLDVIITNTKPVLSGDL